MKDHRRQGSDAENGREIPQERVRVEHQASGFANRSCRMSITILVSNTSPARPIIGHTNDDGKMNITPIGTNDDAATPSHGSYRGTWTSSFTFELSTLFSTVVSRAPM
jgi:hypothetical protein